MTSRFSRGMSTPEILAISAPPSALTLLVSWILADHLHTTVPTDHAALLAHFLHTWTNFHEGSLVAIGDPTSAEVVGGQFHLHFVAGENSDVVHPHLSGDVCEHLVPVFEFDPEHGVGERLDDRPFQDDRVFFGLRQGTLSTVVERRSGQVGEHRGEPETGTDQPSTLSRQVRPGQTERRQPSRSSTVAISAAVTASGSALPSTVTSLP